MIGGRKEGVRGARARLRARPLPLRIQPSPFFFLLLHGAPPRHAPPSLPQVTSITPSILALPPGALVEVLHDPGDGQASSEEQGILIVRRPGQQRLAGGPPAPGAPPAYPPPPPPSFQGWDLVVAGTVSSGRSLKW